MTSSHRPGGVLSRDELVQGLLGEGLSEIIARPSSGIVASSKQKKPKDVADLSLAETKALLAEQQQAKPSSHASRLYAVPKKEREYHKLLHEQMPSVVASTTREPSVPVLNDVTEERPSSLVAAHRAPERYAVKLESSVQRSDFSSSDDSSTAPRLRRNAASSDDDSDKESDRRRARLQHVRQRPKQEAVILHASKMKEDRVDAVEPSNSTVSRESNRLIATSVPPPSDAVSRRNASSSEETSSSRSIDNSSSSEEDSSSDDDDDAAVVRPKFVPKHLRDKPSIEIETAQWNEMEERQRREAERRQQESRALVQQVMVQAQSDLSCDTNAAYYDLDGGPNALVEVSEEKDPAAALDAWEVRELERILEEYEVEQARLRETQELQERRRRPWLDREPVDTAATERRPKLPAPAAAGSKFFHRGAYYMDETEWDATDVRHRAVEYAQAPVLNDHQHRDRSQLPQVMRVKQFGRANQSKYKGLKAEDTTDRKLDILPIVRPKGK